MGDSVITIKKKHIAPYAQECDWIYNKSEREREGARAMQAILGDRVSEENPTQQHQRRSSELTKKQRKYESA